MIGGLKVDLRPIVDFVALLAISFSPFTLPRSSGLLSTSTESSYKILMLEE